LARSDRQKVKHRCNHADKGFIVCFNGTVLDQFFRVKRRETFHDTVDAIRADLDAWLVLYNTDRPHRGYRKHGRRPIETVNSFVSQED
jgi:hypothetical protein